MQTVIADFEQRKLEIEKYFTFIKKVEDDFRILTHIGGNLPLYKIDDDLLKIIKASGFLLLYNLIESTVLNSIVAIFDEIKYKKLAYNQVTEKIKKYWFKNKYKHSEDIQDENLYNKFYLIVEEVISNVELEIKKTEIEYGGGLTSLNIKKTAETLGLSLNISHFRLNKHGKVFDDVVKYRNNLAHGNFSFKEVGEGISYIGDGHDGTKGLGLIHFKDYTIEHLEAYIKDIEGFISQEKYLLPKR